MAEHNLVGKKGEEIARSFLLENGFIIRHLNWRYKKNELDIVAEKNNLLVVVEVKTRTSEYFENPREAVTIKKQKFIITATDAYINEFNINCETRFDIIAVSLLMTETKIEHIEDAFQSSLLL
ncbi:MAG: YraN family protein [Bacteroidales bacterium]|nr:YraN family protein [Bacteroidales bacterium]